MTSSTTLMGTSVPLVTRAKRNTPVCAKNLNYAVGDINSKERGTGARANSGKVSFSLMPIHLLAGACRVFMGGLLKYSAFNWARGMPWSVCYDSFMRHWIAWWWLGEDVDSESGQHHLDHCMANLLFLRHYVDSFPAGDDRPCQDLTEFRQSLESFKIPFDEEEYLERNPDIAKKIKEERT
jgi:hypothetical protein